MSDEKLKSTLGTVVQGGKGGEGRMLFPINVKPDASVESSEFEASKSGILKLPSASDR
jgi:hypothetical protein